MWWENTLIFGPNFANQSHTYKMMWKPPKLDAIHTYNIEPFRTMFKCSNTPEYISLKPNKVYRTSISRTSLPLLNESQSLQSDLIQCVFKSRQDVMGKYPHFPPYFCKPKSYVQNDVKTALIQCISHIQYWTFWNEVQTFQYSWIHIVETKQCLTKEYQSNITSIAEQKSKPPIRPNSFCF
jgi:hypothetical protein